MNKIEFCPVGEDKTVGFFVVEETRINGVSYLLVTETEDDEAEALLIAYSQIKPRKFGKPKSQ